MYLGRMLACGRSSTGQVFLYYRVNSRSFKNRVLKSDPGKVAVLPSSRTSSDFENPYVTYNCCRYSARHCVLANGGQTDPVFEKIMRGAAPRDAIASVLLGMDYEFDSYNTPRIVLYADAEAQSLFLGIITESSLQVEKLVLRPGDLALLSTNEHNYIERRPAFTGYAVSSLGAAMQYLVDGEPFKNHEHGVLGLTVEVQNGFAVESRSLSQPSD
ncbi:MAG: IMP cyclohydrolase [Deltaproteobacteria bacterium]